GRTADARAGPAGPGARVAGARSVDARCRRGRRDPGTRRAFLISIGDVPAAAGGGDRPGPRGAGAGPGQAVRVRRPGLPAPGRVRRAAPGAGRGRRGPGRRGAVRPGGVLDAAGPGAARVRVRAGRAAGHADVLGRDHRGRRRERLLGGRADPGAARLRRGEVRPPDRAVHRPGAGGRADHLLRAAGRARPQRDPRRRPAHRRQPGQADLPGAADRGQPGARRLARRAAGRGRRHPGRRTGRRAQLPLAGGPDREACLRRRCRGPDAPRAAGAAAVRRPRAAGADPRCRATDRRRDRREPAGRVREAAGGRAAAGRGM
ncbi:MAG: 16S rRNA (cytosine(1402)-N(4))-methyltransferase, partial [uncultured Corynebacteriales bacterium]